MRRRISKEDAIIQIYRPQLAGRVTQALDVFDRLVCEVETLTKLGVMIQPGNNGGERFHCTPEDLQTNLDEFSELEKIATDGRAFLNALGYESLRKVTPMVGDAPVGKTVDIRPISLQLPGSEPLEGISILPVKPVK